jgi:hypothetical protein
MKIFSVLDQEIGAGQRDRLDILKKVMLLGEMLQSLFSLCIPAGS